MAVEAGNEQKPDAKVRALCFTCRGQLMPLIVRQSVRFPATPPIFRAEGIRRTGFDSRPRHQFFGPRVTVGTRARTLTDFAQSCHLTVSRRPRFDYRPSHQFFWPRVTAGTRVRTLTDFAQSCHLKVSRRPGFDSRPRVLAHPCNPATWRSKN